MKSILIIESSIKPEKSVHQKIDEVLQSTFDLICIYGVECGKWEDLIDEVLVGDGNDVATITTRHPGEERDDVTAFAKSFFKNEKIEVIFYSLE